MIWLRSPMSVEPVRWPSSTTFDSPQSPDRGSAEVARHGRVAVQRQVAGEGLDLHRRAERERARAQRAVHLGIGVEDGGQGAPAYIGLDARLRGDHVHLGAARGEDRVDADGVLVAERLAERVDAAMRPILAA